MQKFQRFDLFLRKEDFDRPHAETAHEEKDDCAADPCAWIASDSVLMVPFVRNIMKMDYRYMHRHRIRHETHEA